MADIVDEKKQTSELSIELSRFGQGHAAEISALVPSATNGRIDGAPTTESASVAGHLLALWRVVDLAVAIPAVIMLAPLLLLIGIAVRTTSPGPAIFKQTRVGRRGVEFQMWKFRSMRDGTHQEVLSDPDLMAKYVANDFKLPGDDARITRIGGFLRRTSLDELPQLVNIILGSMSLVGVRPIERAQLELRPLDDQALYCKYRPGVTGVWQVEGRAAVKSADRLALDRRQVEEWSIKGNLSILLRTPRAVCSSVGAH
jgi:lipopolysaccharide/colanic/teichoic acid biosynthesis glycosyltransferase